MARVRELLLWAGAALGLLAVAAGLAVALGGFSFLVFRSGSMSPEIPTGGIALSRTVEAADIRTGDVVSVTAASGERITHRVVSSTLRGDEATLVLKGDANATEDSELYVVTSVERVVTSVPYGGYLVAHALTPPGLLAMACLSLMLVVLSGGEREESRPRGPRSRPTHRGRVPARRRLAAGGALLAVVAAGGASVAHTTGTWATYTDKPTGTTTANAYDLLNPTLTCSGGGSSLNFSFPAVAVPGRTMTYDVVLTGGQINATTVSSSASGTNRTFTITSNQAPGALFTTRNYVVTVTARTSTGTSWTSIAGVSFSTYGSILIDMSCGSAT